MAIPFLKYPKPVCNHESCDYLIGSDEGNLGYASGIMFGGIPYEAEVYVTKEGTTELSFVLPFLEDLYVDEVTRKEIVLQQKVLPFEEKVETRYFGALTDGMLEHEDDYNLQTLENYVSLLEENELLFYHTNVRNGYMFSAIDGAGNVVVVINITLSDEKYLYAWTPLEFEPFHDSIWEDDGYEKLNIDVETGFLNYD